MKDILVATDGSEYSFTALDYGIYLGKILETRITGLYIIDIKIIQGPLFDDISGLMGLSPSQEFITLIEKGLNNRADAILEDFESRCKKADVFFRFKKTTGIIDEMIVEEGQQSDIIIVAQRGEHYPLTRTGLMGSTTEAVVRKSSRPVLVTPMEYRDIKNVGIAYDGSPPAERALKTAAELCRKTNWPLTAVFITEDKKRIESLRKNLGAYLKPYGISHEVHTRRGKEEQEILSFTETGNVDLMVMGAYGNSRIREMILGSTTSFVIRRSPIPVLLTR